MKLPNKISSRAFIRTRIARHAVDRLHNSRQGPWLPLAVVGSSAVVILASLAFVLLPEETASAECTPPSGSYVAPYVVLDRSSVEVSRGEEFTVNVNLSGHFNLCSPHHGGTYRIRGGEGTGRSGWTYLDISTPTVHLQPGADRYGIVSIQRNRNGVITNFATPSSQELISLTNADVVGGGITVTFRALDDGFNYERRGRIHFEFPYWRSARGSVGVTTRKGLTVADVRVMDTALDEHGQPRELSCHRNLTPNTGCFNIHQGSSNQYKLKLTNQPARGDTVTVTPIRTHGWMGLTFQPSSVTWTSEDWQTEHTITVTTPVVSNSRWAATRPPTWTSFTIEHRFTGDFDINNAKLRSHNKVHGRVTEHPPPSLRSPQSQTQPEPPTLTLSTTTQSVDEGDQVTFTVTADPAPQNDVTVNVGTAQEMGEGLNYVGSESTDRVTITAGQTTATWTVTAYSDTEHRADGRIEGRIKPGASYTLGDPFSVSLDLLDDDPPQPTPQSVPQSVPQPTPQSAPQQSAPQPAPTRVPTPQPTPGALVVLEPVILSVSDAEAEEGQTLNFVISLNRASPTTVEVAYSTLRGEATTDDYTFTNGRVVFRPGETRKTVHIQTTVDDINEQPERMILYLARVDGAEPDRRSATGTINNN